MVKLAENSSRDVQIAFANQVSSMCEESGINPFEVIELANKHPRVNILNPGCGVGGHCIAVDPWFLVESYPKSSTLLKMARKINDYRAEEIVDKVLNIAKSFHRSNKRKPVVLALGLTFKADIDDLRNSPALKVSKLLKKSKSLLLKVCEPNVDPKALEDMGFKEHVSFKEGVNAADIILVLVKHKQFKNLKNSNQVVIDTCGLMYKSLHQRVRSFLGAQLTRDESLLDGERMTDLLLMP